MAKGRVYVFDHFAGWIEKTEDEYVFRYDLAYLQSPDPKAVSLTLPLKKEPYISKAMFPFFDGLIPEGWLLDLVEKHWKVNEKDRMGLLLAACRDCIGAVYVVSDEMKN